MCSRSRAQGAAEVPGSRRAALGEPPAVGRHSGNRPPSGRAAWANRPPSTAALPTIPTRHPVENGAAGVNTPVVRRPIAQSRVSLRWVTRCGRAASAPSLLTLFFS